MSVRVAIPFPLQQFTGGRESVETTGRTVGECLDSLEARFPGLREQLRDERGRLFDFYEVWVNSDSWYPEEMARPVSDGDQVTIALLIMGG